MAEGRSANYSSCCRLCLSDSSSLKPIFEDEADSRTLAQKILNFLGVEVSSNDKLSTMICGPCMTRVNSWDDFKKECSENQAKLQEWLGTWNSGGSSSGIVNVSIMVKDEPVYNDDNQRQENGDVSNDDVIQSFLIKSEPIVEVEEYEYDNPPLLTPNPPDGDLQEDDDENSSQMSMDDFQTSGLSDDVLRRKESRQCSFCNKSFSTVGNRMKHERIIHSNRRKSVHHTAGSGSVTSNHDESSQHSMESMASSSLVTEESALPMDSENEHSSAERPETDIQKIQFAAGLRLKQTSSASDKSIDAPLSRVELAYLDRCNAMVAMLYTFKCSCHNVNFPTIKRLFAHLRMCYTWFPIFTCYNCVITFSNRSGSMRHTGKCPKLYLENIIRMAEMQKRTESKLRVYQYCKCMKCANLYSFYDDYCEHIDKEHMSEPPYVCLCSKEFSSAEEFKQHLYISCYLGYYCDVCYTIFDNLIDFRVHCENTHDTVEEFTFVTFDGAFKLVNHEEIKAANRKRAYEEVAPPDLENGEDDGNDRKKFITLKSYQEPANCEICDRRFSNYYTLKKHMKGHRKNNYSNGWKNKPSACSKCGKVFSTYYNMMRHYKIHDDSEKQLQCALCAERFRLVSQLKDHLILVHGQANVCQECGRQFESVEELDQHRSVHLNIKVYRDSKTDSYRTSSQSRHFCQVCGLCFTTATDLNDHSLVHDMMPALDGEEQGEVEDKKDFGKFSCLECDRHYVSYKGLWLHNKRHHPDRKKPPQQPYQCKYCDRVLQTNAAYQMHKQMHERMLRQASTVSEPMVVKQGDEEEESYHTCKHCFKVFSSKYNLKAHLKTHGINIAPGRTYAKTGKFVKTFWCDVCHQACQGYAELQKHKQEHVDEKLETGSQIEDEEEVDQKPQLYPCDICGMAFTSKLAVINHKGTHDAGNRVQEKRNFVYCKYCKIPFLNVAALNKHMENEHEETLKSQKNKNQVTKKFPCNLCKKVFDTAGALCSHQGWHKRGKGDKQWKSPQKLLKKVVREMPKPIPISSVNKHECVSCSLMFLTDTALQIHILEAHRNINATVVPPRCTACNIEFTSQDAYDNHSRMHKTIDDSKAFPCKYCNKGFSRSDSLNAHIRQFHNEHMETSFRCHYCNRIFEKQNALTIHLKVHERQKVSGMPVKQAKTHLYSCSICHVGFDIPKDLRNHIITSHPF